jgi:hypothetical protein
LFNKGGEIRNDGAEIVDTDLPSNSGAVAAYIVVATPWGMLFISGDIRK